MQEIWLIDPRRTPLEEHDQLVERVKKFDPEWFGYVSLVPSDWFDTNPTWKVPVPGRYEIRGNFNWEKDEYDAPPPEILEGLVPGEISEAVEQLAGYQVTGVLDCRDQSAETWLRRLYLDDNPNVAETFVICLIDAKSLRWVRKTGKLAESFLNSENPAYATALLGMGQGGIADNNASAFNINRSKKYEASDQLAQSVVGYGPYSDWFWDGEELTTTWGSSRSGEDPDFIHDDDSNERPKSLSQVIIGVEAVDDTPPSEPQPEPAIQWTLVEESCWSFLLPHRVGTYKLGIEVQDEAWGLYEIVDEDTDDVLGFFSTGPALRGAVYTFNLAQPEPRPRVLLLRLRDGTKTRLAGGQRNPAHRSWMSYQGPEFKQQRPLKGGPGQIHVHQVQSLPGINEHRIVELNWRTDKAHRWMEVEAKVRGNSSDKQTDSDSAPPAFLAISAPIGEFEEVGKHPCAMQFILGDDENDWTSYAMRCSALSHKTEWIWMIENHIAEQYNDLLTVNPRIPISTEPLRVRFAVYDSSLDNEQYKKRNNT